MKIKRIFLFILLCLFGVLTVVAFCSSNMFDESYFEYAYFQIDRIWLHVLLLLLLIACLRWISSAFHPAEPWKITHILLAFTLLFSTAAAFFWAGACHYVPVWDPGELCHIALSLSDGQPLTDSQLAYMAKYPHQVGLLMLFQLLLRLFGSGGESFMTLHYFMVCCIPMILLAGYWLCRLLFDNPVTCCCYLLLGCGCFPLFLYVNFIYSDIPGILLMLLALDGLIAYRKLGRRLYGCLGLLCLLLAAIIRKHTLIIVIAVAIIWLLTALQKRSLQQLAEAIIIPAVVILGTSLAVTAASRHYQIPTDKAAPSVVWIAMGMQESRFGCGWFNGYIDQQYEKLQGDPKLLTQEALADIQGSLTAFLSSPRQAISFYLHKLLIQWNQPSYQCLGVSKTYEEMPGELINNIYYGRINAYLRIYFDCYQLLVYLGGTLCLAWRFRSAKHHSPRTYFLIPLLAILGGFLFSLLWEAKSRYILPYFILMLPYAAEGLQFIYRRERKS